MHTFRVWRMPKEDYRAKYPSGQASRVRLVVDGIDKTDGLLARSRAVWDHSEAFEFGYAGSGPAQLALALLLAAGATSEVASRNHQKVKFAFLARKVPLVGGKEEFTLTTDHLRVYLGGEALGDPELSQDGSAS